MPMKAKALGKMCDNTKLRPTLVDSGLCEKVAALAEARLDAQKSCGTTLARKMVLSGEIVSCTV